ncbi:MAG: hypothetical protein HYZ92_00145 [Candidatus Omnitrophica bacterium]|nr:hypothetical protein [Candidatus Omnitrophota bacterium]
MLRRKAGAGSGWHGDEAPAARPQAMGDGGRIGVWGHFVLMLEAPALRTDGGVAP